MCQNSQLRLVNDYCRATRDLRLQIDVLVGLHRQRTEAIGVLYLVGADSSGAAANSYTSLHAESFKVDEFAASLAKFQSIELCLLFVSSQNVYPPLSALKLIAQLNPKCDVIRVSSANLSFEFRPLPMLIEFASAQVHRCGSCANSGNCSAAALAGFPKAHIVVHSAASTGERAPS